MCLGVNCVSDMVDITAPLPRRVAAVERALSGIALVATHVRSRVVATLAGCRAGPVASG